MRDVLLLVHSMDRCWCSGRLIAVWRVLAHGEISEVSLVCEGWKNPVKVMRVSSSTEQGEGSLTSTGSRGLSNFLSCLSANIEGRGTM